MLIIAMLKPSAAPTTASYVACFVASLIEDVHEYSERSHCLGLHSHQRQLVNVNMLMCTYESPKVLK